jgi:hypothetical protein
MMESFSQQQNMMMPQTIHFFDGNTEQVPALQDAVPESVSSSMP